MSQLNSGTTSQSVSKIIEDLDQELSRVIEPVKLQFQELLDLLAGKSFDSFEENLALANQLRDLMLRIGWRVACPREGCGEPALIRCNKVRRTRAGSFEFQHVVDGGNSKTHAARTVLPALKLIPANAHRGRKSSTLRH